MRIVAAPTELDAVSAKPFTADLGDGPVVVDCSRVEFIDSSGLQVLLEARQRAVGAGGQVVLRNPSRVVLRLLKVTSTEELFTIEP